MVPLVEFRGAMFKKSADQTAADFTTATAISFNTEVYNRGGWDITNSTRLQVAPNVEVIQIGGHVNVALSTADTWKVLSIYKNGSSVYDGRASDVVESGDPGTAFHIISGPLVVAEDDYFELVLQEESDASITIEAAGTWFWIRALA
jgi:hypothetical protein